MLELAPLPVMGADASSSYCSTADPRREGNAACMSWLDEEVPVATNGMVTANLLARKSER